MKNNFKTGDVKIYEKEITSGDLAAFESGNVHEVYATFALGRDAEWSSRLFVLEMKDDDEEGIGTFLNITHHSPATLGQKVRFTATICLLEKNCIDCDVIVRVADRVIAVCKTGQKIIKKEKLNLLFESIK